MGRYYFGDIAGKFWFAIQDSYDASFFGIEPMDRYTFYACTCSITDQILKEDLFCDQCFDSYEEHKYEMLENEEDHEKTWYLSESEIRYEFTESDKELVLQRIRELENIVGKYMDSYVIKEVDEEIVYEYEVPKDIPDGILPLIAKLCLGKQIAHSLEKNGSCCFTAEV